MLNISKMGRLEKIWNDFINSEEYGAIGRRLKAENALYRGGLESNIKSWCAGSSSRTRARVICSMKKERFDRSSL